MVVLMPIRNFTQNFDGTNYDKAQAGAFPKSKALDNITGVSKRKDICQNIILNNKGLRTLFTYFMQHKYELVVY
jgi:hypothetical protein